MSRCLNLSPYKMSNNNEEHNSLEKKGIVSILCSDFSNPKKSFSSFNNNINININNTIKRSMSSADMSSQKWQEKNEFPLKRLQSSDHLQSLVEEEENDNKNKKVGPGGAAFEDIWSSILTNKKTDGSGSGSGSGPDPAPYVHPLMKRASSLSEKSLEICTESLGSETGSDGFSSPLSDHGEEHEVVDEAYVVEDEIVRNFNDFVEVGKFSYNYPVKNIKKVNNGNNGVVRSFPPPLLSLAHRDDGSNVEMRTRRQDGRLVVEAVSVPSRNCFRACREDGRLLLTLTNDNEGYEDEDFDDEDEVVEGATNDVPVSDGVVAKVANALTFVMEESEAASGLPKTRVINVHTAASPVMIMTKLMELTSTRNVSSWPRTSNRTVITSLDEGDDDVLGKQVEVESKPSQKKVTALLPPRPRTVSRAKTAAGVLNAYEYYWRRSDSSTAAAVALLTPLAGKQSNAKGVVVSPQVVKDTNKLLLGHNIKGVPKGEVVIVKAEAVEGEYLVPMLRGCKEPRSSLFFWEPFCIATS